MESICDSSPIWDADLTWKNNTWPQFTQCFQDTIAQWIPCLWMWMFAPFYVNHLLSSSKKRRTIRWIIRLKLICSLAIVAVCICNIVGAVQRQLPEMRAKVLGAVIWILTMILHKALIMLEWSRSIVRSQAVFLFWILAAIGTLIQFYSAIILQTQDSDMLMFVMICIKFGTVLVCVFLYCLADCPKKMPRHHNPEITASIPAWILYNWVQRILLKGFRSPITDDDIYDLNPRDVCEKAVTKFLRAWNKEKVKSLEVTLRKRKKQGISREKDDEQDKMIPLLPTSISPDRAHSFSKEEDLIDDDTELPNRECDLSSQDYISENTTALTKSKVSFAKALARCFWLDLLECQWGMITNVVSVIVSPIIIGWLISYIKDPAEQSWHGYIYALALIGMRILYSVFSMKSKFFTVMLSMRVRSAMIASVFRKALNLSSEARKQSTAGEITNLMSVDATNTEMMFSLSFWVWISAALFVAGVVMLYTSIGVALFTGLLLLVVIFLGNFWVMHKIKEYQTKIMVAKDERVKVTNEVLHAIKVIKLYGWEPTFIKKIQTIRNKELNLLLKYSILDSIESFAWRVALFWMLYVMVITFVLLDPKHYLDAETLVPTLYCIDVLKVSILFFPVVIKNWVKAANAVTRLGRFHNLENLRSISFIRNKSNKMAVKITDASFAWEASSSPVLKNISLTVKPGQFVAVAGVVGSGKSSLLSAMLGELHLISGYINLNSSVAYIPQEAWIQNNSIRENILFGQPYDPNHFYQVIQACALQPDLDLMPAGDLTEIGEKGINLSGGQKQRISLARAVYSQADIYLMDDPFSAVDSQVGKHIFQQLFSEEGLLHGKTIILVTHGIQWLPRADLIVFLSNGQIAESGTHDHLVRLSGECAQFLAQYWASEKAKLEADQVNASEPKGSFHYLDKEVPLDNDVVTIHNKEPGVPESSEAKTGHSVDSACMKNTYSDQPIPDKNNCTGGKRVASHADEFKDKLQPDQQEKPRNASQLTTKEVTAKGKVKWALYWEIIKGAGIVHAAVTLLLMICYNVVYHGTSLWLAKWSDDINLANFTLLPANSTNRKEANTFHIGIFTALGVAETVLIIAYSVLLQYRHIAAARKLHQELLDCIMHSPMSFFDTTPVGRILNRFSEDISTLDSAVFLKLEITLDNALKCLGTFIVIAYTMPAFIAAVVPVIVLLYLLQQLYIRTASQLKRIAAKNRSPVYAHFSETLSGVSVIRAFQAQDRFITDSQNKVDSVQRVVSVSKTCNLWLEIRLEILSYILVTTAVIFAVVSRDNLSPGLVGLAVTYALRVSTEMNQFTFFFGELENHVVAIERIREYSNLKNEASWHTAKETEVLPEEWPVTGHIQFIDFSTRYRDGLDLVLQGLECSIEDGEKVGIIGRTGAGKSSMVLSLFRLIEAAEGKITVDGVDISQIGLHALRRRLTILPQDPVLFAGSIRMNLDPFQEKSEAELWEALEHSHLKRFVNSLPNKLDQEVGERGENLSMGQRQLICLARTLLRKTKILILDEATSSVDTETDDLVQKTIHKEFHECTVLTIAHRLNTIMDYDRVLVLSNGKMVEFDSPKNLMSSKDSLFYAMVSSTDLDQRNDMLK